MIGLGFPMPLTAPTVAAAQDVASASAAPGPGGLMALMQNPVIQQLLAGQQSQPPLQAPGLLMPQVPIQPYAPPPLTALSGLFGGGYGG